MASYLLKFPIKQNGSDLAACSFIDASQTLAEADDKDHLVIWYSDLTPTFYRTIVELFNDEDTLDDLRKAGWTIEPAPAGVYQHSEDDEPGIRIESDGGKVDWEPLGTARRK
jgi:hypothetical protein